jgi:hypothetical protein
MNEIWAATVYLLCFVTSAGCSALLVRSYMRNRTALLLWTAVCFVMLALNNFFVVIDLIILPNVEMTWIRGVFSLAGVATLIYGFVWEID